ASITPAFTSSSLNFPIAASSFSSGITPASESLLALTMIMNRIVFSVGLGAGPPDGSGRIRSLALSARRTRPGEIDSLNELLLVVDRLAGGGPETAIDRGGYRRFPDAERATAFIGHAWSPRRSGRRGAQGSRSSPGSGRG